ncbi:DUF485 domain-containing protein [Streptomyces sp. MS06]|uniref:DUF485 domain-containing protein n=1 Tax=Streptomyces sp. MS06 TaxID=3385974 RepID=UPI0039A2E4A4
MSPAPTPPAREPDPRHGFGPWGAPGGSGVPRAGGPPRPARGGPSWPADRWSGPHPPQAPGPAGPGPAHGVHPPGPGAGAGPHPSPDPGSWAEPAPSPSFPPWERAVRRTPFPSPLEQLQDDPALSRLREARGRPVLTVAGALVALFLLSGVLAGEARDFMAVHLAGPLNIGLALSLLQCATTGWAVWWYGRHARTSIDPDSARVRARLDELEEWGNTR